MEKTLKTGKIGQFGAESRVTYGGVKWVVLDARPNMSLCLAEDVLKDENGEVRYMAFDGQQERFCRLFRPRFPER